MFRKLTALILTAALCFCTCGCGSMFDKEYVSVSKYVPPNQTDSDKEEKVSVKDFMELKKAVWNIVATGETTGTIVFDTDYQGEKTEDVAAACWELRTQDALCTYCVENIAYEMKKIVSYDEADIFINYSDACLKPDQISKMTYSTGAEEVILQALNEGETQIAILISLSSYSAENMQSLVDQVYKKNPASCPKAPSADVNMYSGTGIQRLYEININYGLSQTELKHQKEQLQRIKPFEELDTSHMSEGQKALAALNYLIDNCTYTDNEKANSVYSALVSKTANSEGLAYAYVELCRQLGLDSRMVYGQHNWKDHYWNILKLDGEYYHVDVSQCILGSPELSFLRNDDSMWAEYRWDVSSYPKCKGELRYSSIVGEK